MNWTNLRAAAEEIAALLCVSAASISAPGLCLTLSWMLLVAAGHQSSRREPLMMGSMALPELIAATVAQLSQKMRTVEPVREPESSCNEKAPTFEAGDGEAEVLNVVRVLELVEGQARA